MPKAEQIATALLQLRNNPALFDRWAAQSGAFKADGQVFTRAQGSARDEKANQMHAHPARSRVPEARRCTHWRRPGSWGYLLSNNRAHQLPPVLQIRPCS